MDAFLGKLTQHAMSYAIRSGIAITATYAIDQCSRLLKTVDRNPQRDELIRLQERLQTKIRIVSPAIDLIELISARGNTTLESAVSLTKTIRWEIQSLGVRLSKAAAAEEKEQLAKDRSKASRREHEIELRRITQDMQMLLAKIEDAVPLINLAITTSGAKLTTKLPSSVSPSRLLQASMFLTMGDQQFSTNPTISVQIGPTFTLSLYMLFSGHEMRFDDEAKGHRKMTWKEVLHKARVRLIRVPIVAAMQSSFNANQPSSSIPASSRASEYSYHLEIIEDLDDDRVHTFDNAHEAPSPYKDVEAAGIREEFPIHQMSRIFYADTGKILDIGNDSGSNNPILLLKRDVNAQAPRRMMEQSENENNLFRESSPEAEDSSDSSLDTDYENYQDDVDYQLHHESTLPSTSNDKPAKTTSLSRGLPSYLDHEWMAFEVYTEDASEAEDDSSEEGSTPSEASPVLDPVHASGLASSLAPTTPEPGLTQRFDAINISQSREVQVSTQYEEAASHKITAPSTENISPFGTIQSSLSLLEVLIRLTVLQQHQQQSHLSIPDEYLTFFLQESSTTGMDGEERRRMRRDARLKVGFDPYDESPIKRHGEDYQYQAQVQDRDTYSTYSRGGTPHEDRLLDGQQWSRGYSHTPEGAPEPWPLHSRQASSAQAAPGTTPQARHTLDVPSTPTLVRKTAKTVDTLKQNKKETTASPLAREVSLEKDSSFEAIPATPIKDSELAIEGFS